ncbi:molybdopterin biosynthesis protein [Aeromicrobium sp. Root495]|uniref:molybdopterin molybdotransferase MoeA n=1 Tax=Aeromicrobium sp. Root495 TaxID=1736550 RepID=UPI0006F586B1|nr:gephyrin-like molybdotransferase Glp [Aeromicrobium sp. Root495]KQY59824.1 molybdopterin biosynthesis protein [Aeromicrobium sp. Root495]
MADVIEVEQHLARILAATPRLASERVAVRDAVGRTLAADAAAVHDVPAFENSSMDGFAVRHADVAPASAERPVRLVVVADVPAGSALDPALAPGQAVRIMTGSVLPSEADTVVPFEDTLEGLTPDVPPHVTVVAAPGREGAFVRARADDLAVGERVLVAGTVVGPRQVASALATGVTTLEVVRRPRVAIITSGSELVRGDEPLTRGQVPESSGAMLAALAVEAGAEVVSVEAVLDDDAAVLDTVRGLAHADLVVLTGGVSAGAYDAVKSALGGAGLMQFFHVRMQPGKPQGFGAPASGPLLLGLPGNPVSTAVSWEVFVRPALLALQGRTDLHRRVVRVRAATGWRSPVGRRQYVPVSLDVSDPAAWLARPASSGHSGSHLVGSLALADGYAVVPAGADSVEAGQLVDVMLVT